MVTAALGVRVSCACTGTSLSDPGGGVQLEDHKNRVADCVLAHGPHHQTIHDCPMSGRPMRLDTYCGEGKEKSGGQGSLHHQGGARVRTCHLSRRYEMLFVPRRCAKVFVSQMCVGDNTISSFTGLFTHFSTITQSLRFPSIFTKKQRTNGGNPSKCQEDNLVSLQEGAQKALNFFKTLERGLKNSIYEGLKLGWGLGLQTKYNPFLPSP